MEDVRKLRQAAFDAIYETMQEERDVAWPETSALRSECEEVLERCLFDQETALAVLRGEQELDDDPWNRCPHCSCDTYFRHRIEIDARATDSTVDGTPLFVFVCEGCQHVALRGRATLGKGAWWETGLRLRARPDAPGHPYRDDAAEALVDEDDADGGDEVAVAATESEATAGDEWSERRVCPDGGCIGILGGDGTCNVCGRAGDAA